MSDGNGGWTYNCLALECSSGEVMLWSGDEETPALCTSDKTTVCKDASFSFSCPSGKVFAHVQLTTFTSTDTTHTCGATGASSSQQGPFPALSCLGQSTCSGTASAAWITANSPSNIKPPPSQVLPANFYAVFSGHCVDSAYVSLCPSGSYATRPGNEFGEAVRCAPLNACSSTQWASQYPNAFQDYECSPLATGSMGSSFSLDCNQLTATIGVFQASVDPPAPTGTTTSPCTQDFTSWAATECANSAANGACTVDTSNAPSGVCTSGDVEIYVTCTGGTGA